MANEHIRFPRHRHRPLPAVPLVVRRRYLIVVPRPLPRLLDGDSQTDERGAAQVLDLGAQAIARGSARCPSQVLNRGAQAVARGAARCLPQVLDRDAQDVVARGDAMLQERGNLADAQRNSVNITGFICTVAGLLGQGEYRSSWGLSITSVSKELHKKMTALYDLRKILRGAQAPRDKGSLKVSATLKASTECWGVGRKKNDHLI